MNNSDRSQSEQHHSKEQQCLPTSILDVKWSYRWEVYRRLKTLDIECQCSTNEPLLVNLYSPTTAIQIWSVLRQKNASRHQLIDWLDDCWQAKAVAN